MSKSTLRPLPWRRPIAAALAFIAGLALPRGPAAAQEIVTIPAGQSAIVFMVTGQGLTGDIQVRARQGGVPLWDALLSPLSVRQFVVQPGSYDLVLAPGSAPIPLAAAPGHATLVSLAGVPGDNLYRVIAKSEVTAGEIEHSALPSFIDDNRIAPLDYAPIALDGRGAGLTFLIRADF
ncbi:MAG: hypothetical protein JO010_08855 [Alphaproteobacteria bacterium]|nr:hypothetical protein [Alphaproteobacteria bacterium]